MSGRNARNAVSRFIRVLSGGVSALFLSVPLLPAASQDTGGDGAYLKQAGGGEDASKVYFPDAITPESVAEARERAAQQEQLSAEIAQKYGSDSPRQVSRGVSNDPVEQLSDGSTASALAQLSDAERQVLLEAIDGTDICDSSPPIETIRELCRNRIETRSGDFAKRAGRSVSAEEKLLGEGLTDTTRPGLDRIIERLARNVGKADNLENQAIASVALATDTFDPSQAEKAADKPGGDLSPETQSLINALIQQLTNPGGGS